MNRFPVRFALLLLASLLFTSCQQPTTDPDQAVRDLIIGTTWVPDETRASWASPRAYFYQNGSALLNSTVATWSYKSGVLTLVYTQGTTVITEITISPSLSVTASSFSFNYLGGLCHLKRLET